MSAWILIRQLVIPGCFLTLCPPCMIFLSWYATKTPRNFDLSYIIGSSSSWLIAIIMTTWAVLSLKLSTKDFAGPVTNFGFSPKYKSNGLEYCFASTLVYAIICYIHPQIPLQVYRNIPQLIATTNIVAFVLCAYLWWRGKNYPQTKEKLEKNLPAIFEFYRGVELHPTIFGVNVKQLTNCRFGLMLWHLLVINNWFVSYNDIGWNLAVATAALLQMAYLFKFYLWESSYFDTLDMTLDRAGFYICWGCLVFVPGLYAFDAFWYVTNPPRVSDATSLVCLVVGISAVLMTLVIDNEKSLFRISGTCFFTSKPKFVSAEYKDAHGVLRKSRLLASGFWSVSRHLNYVMELTVYYAWSVPGWYDGVLPFACAIMLTVLLIHRTYRDEDKCRAKYGKAWDVYCSIVRYKMIPYVF